MTVRMAPTQPPLLLRKAGRFLHAVRRTVQARGVVAAARLSAALIAEILMRPITRRQDRLMDRRLGIGTDRSTAEPVLDPAVAASARYRDSVAYSPTPVRLFRKILRSLPVPAPGRFTFVDLGCGKGRTLLLAADHGFGRVIGVEFDAELAQTARRNAAVCDLVTRSTAGAVEVVCGDAARYEFPREPTVVFLFNPFGEDTLRAVVDQIEQTLALWPRPFVVAYFNPMHEEVLDGSTTLRATRRNSRWCVYTSVNSGEVTGTENVQPT